MLHRRPVSFRSRLALLVAIMVLFPVVQLGSASAEDAGVSGTYSLSLHVPKTCEIIQGGFTHHLVIQVEQSGETVTFVGGGQKYPGSISPGLNFDVPVETDHWIGHFTLLSDGGATISGQVVGECSGVTRPYINISGERTSGGPPQPSSSPSLFPGGQLGLDSSRDAENAAIKDLCGGDHRNQPCLDANEYGADWNDAMIDDIASLGGLASEEAKTLLGQLRITLEAAATLGQLHCPNSVEHAFPMVSSLLPNFGRLFVQAVTQVARKKPLDDLERTVFYADTLLRDALNGVSQDLAAGNPFACTHGAA